MTYYYGDDYKEVLYSAATQSQPPLDYWIGYVLFKFWPSDFTARLPAAVFGTLLVLCTFFLARRLMGRPIAILISLGLACAPYSIHYSQEARPYAIFWFALVLSILLLSRAWEHNRPRDWLLFLPALFFCQQTRTLGPLMMTTGMGVWALTALCAAYREHSAVFFRDFLKHRATRLSICLVIVWVPFLYILNYIVHRAR